MAERREIMLLFLSQTVRQLASVTTGTSSDPKNI